MRTTTRNTLLLLAAVAVVLAGGIGTALAVGTPAGTVISNQATVDFEDAGGTPFQTLSNIVTTTMSQVATVDVAPDNAATGSPGDTLYYAHTVTNSGNAADTIDMTASSSNGWTITLYEDVDGDGLYNGAVDVLLADTDADTVPDTGSLAADATFDILVAVTIPAGTADGTSDTTTVTGTSTFDTLVSESATDTTTVGALSVVKSVAPAGTQPPGATLTYSVVVTNNRTTVVNNVVVTDPIPANTTYVAGTITENAAARTDAGGDDNADFNVTTANAITVDVGSLAASGGSVTVTFQVTID